MSNLDRCLDQLRDRRFAEQVRTDELTVPEVADYISGLAGLDLQPNRDTAAQRRLRQAWIGLRHVRFG